MSGYALLADAVLLLHVAIVLFVVGGWLAIVFGNLRGWAWVNAPWMRLAHAAAIAIVVVQAWLGQDCPLTTLESWLRLQSGAAPYERGFIETWLHRLLFYDAPPWTFIALYTAFGLLVLATWWRWPPRRRR